MQPRPLASDFVSKPHLNAIWEAVPGKSCLAMRTFPQWIRAPLDTGFIHINIFSLGFGIVFATALILFVVPCLYLALDDLMGAVDTRRRAFKYSDGA